MPLLSPTARRRVLWTLVILLAVLGLGAGGGYWYVRRLLQASMPRLTGEPTVAGLVAPVTVERDAAGVVSIRAESSNDLVYALGFVHAQERYFQMDLARRSAAGELCELVGAGALDRDREVRVHQFRQRAERAFKLLPREQADLLRSYTAGVNAGLADLQGWPFEYHLLGVGPGLWLVEDCLLVVYAMYLVLQSDIWQREAQLAELHEGLPRPVFELLSAVGDEWDAPLKGEPLRVPPIPGPDVFDLRKKPPTPTARPDGTAPTVTTGPTPPAAPTPTADSEPVQPGSNNWAIAGAHTQHGGAILANDMHLELRLPNFWFRACFHYPDPRMPGTLRRAVGVTLPGTPVLVVGSTGKVAWGFTNTQADWSDLVVVEFDELETNDYRTPQGLKPLEKDQELIRIKDSPDRPMTIEKTIWGPVIGRDHAKRRRALRWVAHDPEGINLRLFDLLFVHTLEEALDVANHCGMPHQNFVVADDQGGIAWTVTGRIPKRQGAAGRLPVSWADGTNGWTGYVPPAEAPRVLRPASGRLWTANNRTMSGPELDMLGFGAYDRGARARQIRDRLADLDQATEKDLLDIQLDNRALFLERWRGLFLKTINSPKRTLGPDLQLARDLVTNWQGRAVPECVGFRLVYDWRRRVQGAVMGPITAACRGGTGGIVDNLASPPDGALWKILEEQPLHLLDPIYQSYDGLLFLEIKKLVEELAEERGGLMARTWGERNEVMVNHPVTLSLGMLGPWLNAPPRRLPGAPADMPRIQGRRFGASERLVVSPGKEEQGLFHMPGGQSGHPGNPNYLNGFDAWANGDATPLLPGPKVNEFTLRPRQ